VGARFAESGEDLAFLCRTMVLRKVYRDNALKLLPRLASKAKRR